MRQPGNTTRRDVRGIAPTVSPEMTINGRQVLGTGAGFTVYNPATAEELVTVPAATAAEVDAAVVAAHDAFDSWAALSGERRAAHLHRFADALQADADRLVSIIIDEVGTPVTLAETLQIQYPIDQLRWYADAVRADPTVDLGPTTYGAPRDSKVYSRPVGVVAAISAYNYPIHLGLWKIGAALAAGCTTVLMPSPRTPLACLEVGRLAVEAGLPAGVFNVVVGGPEVGRLLTEHPKVRKVSFTGSDAVGARILHQTAPDIKRVTLELGGKSAAIVLPGADLSYAASRIHPRYARNAGQGCASPTRILVQEKDLDGFVEASEEVYDGLVVGDPRDRATTIGPVIRPEHLAGIERAVAEAVAGGATIALGGGRPDFDRGWWINPHLLTNVANTDPVAQREIFGPVAVVITYTDVDDAVAKANDSRYGLNAYLFGDTDVATTLPARLRAGTVSVNDAAGLRPDAPFGGFGASGLGREGGRWGLDAFYEIQHVQTPIRNGATS